jgi:hypothetical protein
MGREIRRVPPNWSHPTHMVLRWGPRVGYRLELEYVPMEDEHFPVALAKWEAAKAKWDAGERLSYAEDDPTYTFEEDEGPSPTPLTHRPYSDDEATWFQLFQTVSEGSPVSPPFATLDELAAYLAEHGDFWDQSRAVEEFAGAGRLDPDNLPKTGWGQARADAFCKLGRAPSMMVRGGEILTNPGDMASA